MSHPSVCPLYTTWFRLAKKQIEDQLVPLKFTCYKDNLKRIWSILCTGQTPVIVLCNCLTRPKSKQDQNPTKCWSPIIHIHFKSNLWKQKPEQDSTDTRHFFSISANPSCRCQIQVKSAHDQTMTNSEPEGKTKSTSWTRSIPINHTDKGAMWSHFQTAAGIQTN